MPRPSRTATRLWLIFEAILFMMLLSSITMDSWSTLLFSESCTASTDLKVEALNLSLFSGLHIGGSCSSKKDDESLCIAFENVSLWKSLDMILGTRMEYDASIVVAAVQIILPAGGLMKGMAEIQRVRLLSDYLLLLFQ